ncbi:hypothetical protein LCGC14_1740160 [marine sediment metagenome]|uniref:Uncharacterized protein n=1 Tax=marine sediment metagenome TaxID=412755 RepID=A0A0F9H6X0_9ZZZZ
MTSGPWVAYYAMNNEGKTIDRFTIPEQWRTDIDRMLNNETLPDILDKTRKGEKDEEVRVGIPRRAGGSI